MGGAYIRRGLSTEGNLRFKIDCASLIVGSKFTVFALFLYLRAIFQGAYIWRGDLAEGFSRHRFGGAYIWRAYTWRGLFSEFYGIDKIIDWHTDVGLILFY